MSIKTGKRKKLQKAYKKAKNIKNNNLPKLFGGMRISYKLLRKLEDKAK